MAAAPRWSCLMYHEIPDDGEPGYYAVPRARFGAQLDALARLGLAGTTLESALADPSPARVAITFDDGHATHFTDAFPELAARRMAATFFVITARVGTNGYATWDQLRAMRRAGMSIQSHTHTHPFLSELSAEAARTELRESRRRLDAELDQETTTLALPGGDAPRGWSARDFADAGFRWVATSRWGPNAGTPATFVRRYTVRRETMDPAFARLATAREPAHSLEGLRLRALGGTRTLLGASRYARWRRAALRLLGR